jgi:hypothetical protein
MRKVKSGRKRKKYARPTITYEQGIPVLAVACDIQYGEDGKLLGGCVQANS